MATKYDSFLAPSLDRGDFTSNTAPGSIIYPDANQVSVFGPLFLPRVYGKDLSAFEVASSGYVAISLNDIHSLDILRNNATSNITIKAFSNDSFGINVNESNMYMTFDSTSNAVSLYAAADIKLNTSNITAFASNDATFTACNVMTLNADTLDINVASDFAMEARNLSFTGRSNVAIEAQTGDLFLNAYGSNVYVRLWDSNQARLEMYAASNVETVAGSNWQTVVSSNASLSTADGSIVLSGHNSNMTLTMDAATDSISLVGTNQLNVSTTNAVNITSTTSSVILKASGSNVRVELKNDSNLDVYAKSNVTVTADGLLTLQSTDKAAFVSSNELSISAFSNMTLQSFSNYTLNANSNINMQAAGGLCYINLNAPTQSISAAAASNVTVSASNDVTVSASNNMTIKAVGVDFLLLNSNATLTAAGDFSLRAAQNVLVDAQANDFQLHAGSSNMYLTMSSATNDTTISTSNDFVVRAGNDVSVSASNDATVLAVSDLHLNARNGLAKIDLTLDTITYTACNQIFSANGNNIIEASSNLVRINGDVEVLGTLNTVNYTQCNLTIMDKQITLAYDSNDAPVADGIANDKSGVTIAGDQSSPLDARSFLWNYNQGRSYLGTVDVDKESFWELKGGQLRMTQNVPSIGDISFGFRINQLGELEIVKKVGVAGFKRIAKFGRTFM